jgi:hypothetical protein
LDAIVGQSFTSQSRVPGLQTNDARDNTRAAPGSPQYAFTRRCTAVSFRIAFLVCGATMTASTQAETLALAKGDQ